MMTEPGPDRRGEGADEADQAGRVYEVVAAFAAGLVEHGVRDIVISPGSRSTPLAVTLHAHPELLTWIQIDERSAGFFALGQAKVTGRPSVLVCTSGTAAANYLPAVVEAHHSGVPLIVCTADRPPELRGWGAGQTIDQVGIYGWATRWAVDLPVAGERGGFTPHQARMVAHRAVDAAGAVEAGPVHLNWPLREPLEPRGPVPVALPAIPAEPAVDVSAEDSTPVPAALSAPAALPVSVERGVIVMGPDAANGFVAQHAVVDAALRLSARTGWPVIGEPISGVRRPAGPSGARDALGAGAVPIANAGPLLRLDAIARELRPDLVIRVGGSPTTKPVRQWLARHEAPLVLIDPARRWNDASFTVTWHLDGDPVAVLDSFPARSEVSAGDSIRSGSTWRDRWVALDRAAAEAIDTELERGRFLSAGVVRALTAELPAGTLVMTSNSMPVRDLDTFVPSDGPPIGFVGNRGASGIDGITSTALGLASRHGGPVVLLTGDLALLHDLGALFGAARARLHLTIVCIDNDGGGIFSMLPIAGQGTAVDFETLFRTPHGLDLAGFDGIGGVRATHTTTEEALVTALDRAIRDDAPGIDLLIVPVDRDADLAQRAGVGDAVAIAVTASAPPPTPSAPDPAP